MNPLTGITWARIPHFFNSPYYVYQYATCFASAARLAQRDHGDGQSASDARERYLTLLRSGGNDYPMEQLKKAGVDLASPTRCARWSSSSTIWSRGSNASSRAR